MRQLYYRPKRLQKNPADPNKLYKARRRLALLLCACMILAMIPSMALAADRYTVRFVNHDLSELGIQPVSDVPEGAKLFTAEELAGTAGFSPREGCTWYLYYEGGGESETFGPVAIPDPVREGYLFRDWAAQGAADDTLYTVTGSTTFVARYISESQYVINLYYQFDNDSHTVAAETTTTPYGQNETISMELPSTEALSGLNPQILTRSDDASIQHAVNALNRMIQAGRFTGTLDDTFLENCRIAGYVAWDDATNDYQKDENGNVQISIPVTYVVTGTITFLVEYWQQNADDDDYTRVGEARSGSVEGTTRVNLKNLGLVEQYDGFSLTTASAEDANSYTVSADSSNPTTIKLYYNRDTHYLYYEMSGGNVVEPVALRYGQSVGSELADPSLAARTGYNFSSWTWLDENGEEISKPGAMPNHDLTLRANWVGTNTTVTLIYWLENANDDNYTVAGQRTISVTSGQTVGYEHPGHQGEADVSINGYLSAGAMKIAGIDDGEYFTFASADSSTAIAPGAEGKLKTAAGDGSTVINIGYTRNEYTLVFHLGRERNSLLFPYDLASSGYSQAKSSTDWQTGYSFQYVAGAPSLTIGGTTYHLTDDTAGCYPITAKYGAFISDQWPTQDHLSDGGLFGTYTFYGWGTHANSLYSQQHPEEDSIINGFYSTLSADLIVDPQNPDTVHHLMAYYAFGGILGWLSQLQTVQYHFYFEKLPFIDKVSFSFQNSDYAGYTQLNNSSLNAVAGLDFYQYGGSMTITIRDTVDLATLTAPQFSHTTFQYGCYNGSDIYFFYTYDDYILTYHENNANMVPGQEQPANTEQVYFHYVEGYTFAEQIDNADYTPKTPYVSTYGNGYEFIGWYTANLTEDATDNERFRIDWNTFAPSSNINVYAAWKAPSFTLTLIVPDGTLYPDFLNQFYEKGYTVETLKNQPAGGTTYEVSGIPGGTRASEIVRERHGAQNVYSLAFDYWSYQVGGREQQYLFSESHLITSDLTLTARWKTEYTGQYIVRYLTTEPQNNNLGTVTIDGTEYYRLQADKTVTGVAVGSSVTEAAAVANGYLSAVGEITKVVEAPEDQMVKTYFDFFYAKITGPVTYTVHHVLDSGTDYGRTAPPDDVVRLAADKTVNVDMASLNQSTTVSEAAVVVGGYSPRDSWNISFTLSADAAQNHLYIYYVPNTHNIVFKVTYLFEQKGGGYAPNEPGTAFQLTGEEALGKVLSSADLVKNYGKYLDDTQALDALMVGHVLDTAITEPYLLLTRGGENLLRIYMKNGAYTLTYHLNDGGDQTFPATWENADEFLTGGAISYTQTITYPNPADVPKTTPTRLSYQFTGWRDASGTIYPADQLGSAPWYQERGMREDVALYAQWGKQLTITFNLRGGTWTDTGGQFHLTNGAWHAYAAAGAAILQPSAPTFTASDGTAHSFIGWTTANPDESDFVGADGRVDLVEFERYRFDFAKGIAQDTTLYAVWDPDVTTFALVKTDTGAQPLAGAVFTLERLKSAITGNPDNGYTYNPIQENGAYVADSSFPVRTITTGQRGTGAFSYLPAGYYRLTETVPPAGYVGLAEPVILFAPYGAGSPYIVSPAGSGTVTGTPDGASLTIQIRNVSQYNVTITAPDSLTLTYTPPDLIWNPETLAYEGISGSEGGWIVSASTGQEAVVTVVNSSLSASVQVEVSLQYDAAYQTLLPLSTLTAEKSSDSFLYEKDTGVLTGILTAPASASFRLSVEGTLPLDVLLPTQETQAGTLTIRITKPSG